MIHHIQVPGSTGWMIHRDKKFTLIAAKKSPVERIWSRRPPPHLPTHIDLGVDQEPKTGLWFALSYPKVTFFKYAKINTITLAYMITEAEFSPQH